MGFSAMEIETICRYQLPVLVVVDPRGRATALTASLASRNPALINCAIDPKAGTENGRIADLSPRNEITPKK